MTTTNFSELATELKEEANTIKNVAKTAAQNYLRQVLADNPDLYRIEWRSIPNSYCDEGYFEEGNITLYGHELDELRPSDRYGNFHSYDAPGVWSLDDDYGYNDDKSDRWSLLAKEVFTELNKLSGILGMDGENSITVTR